MSKTVDLLKNESRNHHYVSQAEQRLNSLNPEASKRAQRIFAFSVEDRERFTVKLDDDHGIHAGKNLAFQDLFSFDVQGEACVNLEKCFQRYENDITTHTKSFIDKVITKQQDITEEFLTIFTCKFMNFLRNPNCVKKVLHTVGLGATIDQYHPADLDQRALLAEFMKGLKPYQESVLQEFGINIEDYRRWAKALFLLTAVGSPGQYALDASVRDMLSGSIGATRLFYFSDAEPDAFCLLSDRGHNDVTQPDQRQKGGSVLEFNLTSKAFIRVILVDVEGLISPEMKANPRLAGIGKSIPRSMRVDSIKDDMGMLSAYNRNAVYQCKRRVFCAARAARGVIVARST